MPTASAVRRKTLPDAADTADPTATPDTPEATDVDGCGTTTGAGATGTDDGVVHDESGDGEAGGDGAGFGVAVVALPGVAFREAAE